MQVALRPYVTAGVAVVGAGLISVTPALVPDIEQRVEQGAVELMSAAYPVITYGQLLTDTVGNTGGLAQTFLKDPFPVLSQLFTNWQGYAQVLGPAAQDTLNKIVTGLQGFPPVLEHAFSLLQSGEVFQAVQAVMSYGFYQVALLPLLPLLEGVSHVGQTIGSNVDSLITYLTSPLGPGAILLTAVVYGPFNAIDAAAGIAQNLVDDLGAGNLEGVLTNLVLACPTILGGALNGYPEGILSPLAILTNPLGVNGGESFGAIQNLLELRVSIAQALGASSAAAAKAVGAAVDPAAATNLSAAAADISSAVSGLSAALNPATLAADLSTVLNPADLAAAFGSALSSIGDIPALLTSLIP